MIYFSLFSFSLFIIWCMMSEVASFILAIGCWLMKYILCSLLMLCDAYDTSWCKLMQELDKFILWLDAAWCSLFTMMLFMHMMQVGYFLFNDFENWPKNHDFAFFVFLDGFESRAWHRVSCTGQSLHVSYLSLQHHDVSKILTADMPFQKHSVKWDWLIDWYFLKICF